MKICVKCKERYQAKDWVCPKCHKLPERVNGYYAFSPGLDRDNIGFNVKRFSKIAELQTKNFWFTSRNRLISWAIKRYFPEASNYFEVGCGTGSVLSSVEKEFPQLELFGSDVHADALSFCSKIVSRAQLFQMDACDIPFYEEFDVVGAFDILEHIKEDKLVLSQIYKAVNKGGGLIVTVPQYPGLWSYIDEIAYHVRRYTKEGLKSKVEEAGFRVLKITSFVSFLLVPMIISRIKIGKKPVKDEVRRDLMLCAFLNRIFDKVSCFERKLICADTNIPFGGSILLVAKKEAGR